MELKPINNRQPYFKIDEETGKIYLKGRSVMENVNEYYKNVMFHIEQYLSNPVENITLEINLEYFNTTSSKYILDVFKVFEKFKEKNNKSVEVNWYFEEDDEDIMDAGLDYESIVRLKFNHIPKMD